MPNSQPQLDLVFQALSDPTRRAIVERLGRGPASVSQLAQPFAMSLPAVLQHVAVLEASGLVRSEKTGRVRTCKIDSRTLSVAGRLDPGAADDLGATPRSTRRGPRRPARLNPRKEPPDARTIRRPLDLHARAHV